MDIRISLNEVEIYLLAGLVFFFIFQLYYLLKYFGKPAREMKYVRSVNENDEKPPVSIIVFAKNESENLSKFLPYILEQNYPNFEVIIINDGGTEETDMVVGRLREKYKNIYCTYIPEDSKHLSRKKLGLLLGIKAAKYDDLLFTEPNCVPVDREWISYMSRHFVNKASIVIGYSLFPKQTRLKMKYAAYDNLFHTLQFLSFALKGKAYKGVATDLAYTRKLFFESKGFYHFQNLEGGDDDLFVNVNANEMNTGVELSNKSYTLSYIEDFRTWKDIRLSFLTTQKYYKRGPVLFWHFELFTRVLFWLFSLLSISLGIADLLVSDVIDVPLLSTAVILLFIRFSVFCFIFNRTSKRFRTQRFHFYLFLFDLFQPFFEIYLSLIHRKNIRRDYI